MSNKESELHTLRSVKGCLTVCLLTFISIHSYCSADDLSQAVAKLNEQSQALSPKQRVLSQRKANQTVDKILSEQDVPIKAEQDPSEKVVGHYIVKPGVSFIAPEQVILEPVRTTFDPPVKESTKKISETPLLPPPIPRRCTSSGITKLVRDPEGKPASVLVDELYIPKNLLPENTDEVFGLKTKVFSYDGASNAGSSDLETREAIERDGIPCVPFRLRITERYEYRETGKEVFKNYDKEPEGRGFYHSWIKEKLASLTY